MALTYFVNRRGEASLMRPVPTMQLGVNASRICGVVMEGFVPTGAAIYLAGILWPTSGAAWQQPQLSRSEYCATEAAI